MENESIFNRKFKTDFNKLKYSRLNIPSHTKYNVFHKEHVKGRFWGFISFFFAVGLFTVFNYRYGHDFHSIFGHVHYHDVNSCTYNYLDYKERVLNEKLIKRKIKEDKVDYLLDSVNFKFKINN